ncbi:hypothetical protein DN752_19955 [Echinicola strongylocentroti]|uniref:EpsG family protein n=1 Tax=Echinicola strongylocentroti TaxID=1795355 RepID=A0A2Z4INC4_9BACT|nr:EpsG family protein [Echinicola strongylocentroti]AWW32230.1 hypothetical protein DN752_19955 [Echinicola strongylocentroti]
MGIYLFIYLWVASLTFVYFELTEKYRKQLKIAFYLLIIFLIFVTILRREVGTDYETYLRIYENSPTLSQFFRKPFNGVIEPGYSFLNVIAKISSLGFPFVSFVCICLILYNYHAASRHFNLNFYLVFLTYVGLYFFSHNFNVIRHGVATSFIWHSFSLLVNKNNKKNSIALLVISSFFHYMSLLFIPFLWIMNKKISYKIIIGTLVFSIFLILTKLDLVTKVLDYLFYWSPKYQFYKSVYYINVGAEGNYGIAMGVIFNLLLIFSLIIVKARENTSKSSSDVNKIIFNGFYFSLLFLLLLSFNGVFAERIGGVFYVSLIFLLPLIFKMYFDERKVRFLFSMIFVLYIGMYYFKGISVKEADGEYQYLPYKSVINLNG